MKLLRSLTHLVLTLGVGILVHAPSPALSSVTVYYQQGQTPLSASPTATGGAASYTGAAAYNPTVLNPPPVPSPFNTQFVLQLQNGGMQGLSIPQAGSFFGFSIEMSVANQVLGKNSSFIQVPFLNLMANLQQRAGRVHVRVGGNTQETAVLVDSTSDGRILEKDISGASNPTQTPPLVFTRELLYMMRNISSMVNVRWYLGIPFNDTSNFRLGIIEAGQNILGDYLIGLQAGNEPDLYARHGHRPQTYGPFDYLGEVSNLVTAMNNDQSIPNKNLLIAPNLATGDWIPEQVWDTGFVDQFTNNLAFLAVEHYPIDNCFAQFNVGTFHDPQATFPMFLDHNGGKNIIKPYLNSTAYAQTKNKQFLMFETNTASCGGFPGISDSFGAALWGLDYALQMAYSNFSGALFHVGGQNVYYNPFTSPPTNQSTFRQWTIGPIYYSALVMAEAIGPSNNSQVVDLNANNGDVHTPAYAIYENGNAARVVIINFVTDPSGNSQVNAQIAIGGSGIGQPNQSPAQVKVKYLLAPSVSTKGNFSWAGQTFGGNFESDGRLQGQENVTTIQCDQGTNLCSIPVPAPGVALVFLTDDALSSSENGGGPSTTFATTAHTKTQNTATIDPSVLATSNGHSGMGNKLGSTSHGSVSAASSVRLGLGMGTVLLGIVTAAAMSVFGRAMGR